MIILYLDVIVHLLLLIFFCYVVNVSFPGKIIINVNAQNLCVSGKRNYIAINYYPIFININTFLSSVK